MESTCNIFDGFSTQVNRLKRNKESLENLYKKFEYTKGKNGVKESEEEVEASEEEDNGREG